MCGHTGCLLDHGHHSPTPGTSSSGLRCSPGDCIFNQHPRRLATACGHSGPTPWIFCLFPQLMYSRPPSVCPAHHSRAIWPAKPVLLSVAVLAGSGSQVSLRTVHSLSCPGSSGDLHLLLAYSGLRYRNRKLHFLTSDVSSFVSFGLREGRNIAQPHLFP